MSARRRRQVIPYLGALMPLYGAEQGPGQAARLIRGTWGALLLADPGLPLRLGGGEDSRAVRMATRILGARHLVEALILSRDQGRARRTVAGIDGAHAASMLLLALASPRLRRDALLSAASASGLAALSLSEDSPSGSGGYVRSMADQDPQELSKQLERETDELGRQGQEVEDQIKETRADWERKRRDENVPGAVPPEEDEESPAEAETEPPPEARREG